MQNWFLVRNKVGGIQGRSGFVYERPKRWFQFGILIDFLHDYRYRQKTFFFDMIPLKSQQRPLPDKQWMVPKWLHIC